MTNTGQLVIDELIKTWPEAAQFQHKGFIFWDHMSQFVPPDKTVRTFAKLLMNMSWVLFRISVNPPAVSPLTIPVSPPSSAMISVDSSISHSPSVSSSGRKHKSNATAELDTMPVAATASSWKQWTQMSGLEDKVQEFMTSFNDLSNRMANQMLSALDDTNTSKDQKPSNMCTLIYDLGKSLSADNLIHLQMLFEENLSFITGYQCVAAHLASLRMQWVKLRLEVGSCSVPEYTDI
ncbi:hypothetical protein EDC04DRAFT_2611122 [Pisolithus marmoratus]|nr:hypothetical protein EDC04DRAFT_2611122 [Pisolithus marmoratus]